MQSERRSLIGSIRVLILGLLGVIVVLGLVLIAVVSARSVTSAPAERVNALRLATAPHVPVARKLCEPTPKGGCPHDGRSTSARGGVPLATTDIRLPFTVLGSNFRNLSNTAG